METALSTQSIGFVRCPLRRQPRAIRRAQARSKEAQKTKGVNQSKGANKKAGSRGGEGPLMFPDGAKRQGFLREAEVLHARWAMLGVLGLIVPDILGRNLYLLPDLATQRLIPFTIQLLVAVGALEAYRGTQRMEAEDLDSRVYPGKLFDVLGFTEKRRPEADSKKEEGPAPGLGVYSSWLGGLPGWLSGAWWFEKRDMTQQEVQDMKARELSSGRLAMVAFSGVYVASMITGRGPITLLQDHLADPLNNSILHFFQ